jgi:hypothetical protein
MNAFDKRQKQNRLLYEERLFNCIYWTHFHLSQFLKTGEHEFRTNAVKTLRKGIDDVLERYRPGGSRLVDKAIGEQIELFNRNIRRHLLPTMKGENDELDGSGSLALLSNIMKFLMTANPEDLPAINSSLASLKHEDITDTTLTARLFGFWTRSEFNDRIMIIATFLIPTSIALLLYYGFGLPRELSITVWAGLEVPFINALLRRFYTKEH